MLDIDELQYVLEENFGWCGGLECEALVAPGAVCYDRVLARLEVASFETQKDAFLWHEKACPLFA